MKVLPRTFLKCHRNIEPILTQTNFDVTFTTQRSHVQITRSSTTVIGSTHNNPPPPIDTVQHEGRRSNNTSLRDFRIREPGARTSCPTQRRRSTNCATQPRSRAHHRRTCTEESEATKERRQQHQRHQRCIHSHTKPRTPTWRIERWCHGDRKDVALERGIIWR
jgi:hypothetical protein